MLIRRITGLLSDKMAEDIVVIDMRQHLNIVDYFVLCSVGSERQAHAVAGYVKEELRKAGVSPQGIEGVQPGKWVIMDYGDVALHIFLGPVRLYYDIDGLWSDARRAVPEEI